MSSTGHTGQGEHGDETFLLQMRADSGFAPNPFFGVMTLATCRPAMRRSKCAGDWIAGFTSKALCGDDVGEERLIFLMRVTGKIPMTAYTCAVRG